MTTQNKWSRAVSIIGTAYTTFGNVLETPAIKWMTYRELFSWAALHVFESAGITPKDVDCLLVANFMAEGIQSEFIHTVAAEWLGLETEPSVKFETACASGANGLRLPGSLIASGLDDIVLVAGVEVVNSVIDDDLYKYPKQPAARLPNAPDVRVDFVRNGFDCLASEKTELLLDRLQPNCVVVASIIGEVVTEPRGWLQRNKMQGIPKSNPKVIFFSSSPGFVEVSKALTSIDEHQS